MLNIVEIYNEEDLKKYSSREEFVDFLYEHLDRFGDTKSAINKCIDYAFSKSEGKGGFLLGAFEDNKLIGALVMNKSGMAEYIPEYILVYIAVNSNYRGRGIGKQIIDKAKSLSDGDIKLHVEYDNPAKRLYEREGFENKYAEMRFKNKS
jgi:ribosomal protein S18 acetylase RimI-like enzyme